MFRKFVGLGCALCVCLSLFVLPCKAVEVEVEETLSEDVLLSSAVSTLSVGGSSFEDVPPTNPPFYGACYVTGTTSTGNTITLYFPNTYKSGYLGVDSNGYLVNVSATSISGYYSGGYNNSFTLSRFEYPEYRASSSSYDYATLYFTPVYTNMEIETEFSGRVSVEDLLPYVYILLLGVIVVCFMKRW